MVVPPAYFLVELLDEHEQSHQAVADHLGMDAWTFIRFLGGHVEITASLADRLEAFTGVRDTVWLEREAQWRRIAGPPEPDGDDVVELPSPAGDSDEAYRTHHAWR